MAGPPIRAKLVDMQMLITTIAIFGTIVVGLLAVLPTVFDIRR